MLQENIIFYVTKEAQKPTHITISSSIGPEDEGMSTREVNYWQVIYPEDPKAFIHIVPDESSDRVAMRMAQFHCTLEDLDLEVSTGRVVDFRAKSFLRRLPEAGQYHLFTRPILKKGMLPGRS